MSTTIVIIRHAQPEDPDKYTDDSLRPLTSKGKDIQQLMSQYLKKEGFKPELILTSPLLRARQTAEILSQIFNSISYIISFSNGWYYR